MSNKDQNKNSWQNRLDELDELPGEVLPAKNASWEKLHSRLQEKPKQRVSYWYWAAAACLFIFAILPWAMKDKNPQMTGQTIASFEQNEILVVSKPLTGKITKEKITNNEQPAKENGLPVLRFIEKNITVKPKQVITNKGVPVHPVEFKITSAPIIDIVKTLPVTDTAQIPLTVAAAKKTLRVVHINEIAGPGQKAIAETDNNGIGFRRFIRHSNKDVSVGEPVTANPAEHILIKNLNAQN